MRVAGAVAGVVGLLVVAGPGTAATISDTALIAPTADVATGQAVDVDDDGRAVAAWVATAPGRAGVIVRTRSGPRAAWGPRVRVSLRVPDPGTAPVVAIGEDGRVLVAWVSGGRVVLSGRPAGASGGEPFVVRPPEPPARGFTSARLVGPTGRATLAWVERDVAGRWTARRATYRLGAWDEDPPVDLVAAGVVSDPAAPAEPAVALGRDGDTAFAWPAATETYDQERVVPVRVLTRVGRAGGMPGDDRWQPVLTLSAAGHQVAVGAGPFGHLVATWVEGEHILAAVRTPGAVAFDAAETIDVVEPGGGWPVAAVNGQGYAVAAWGTWRGGNLVVRAALRSGASELWEAPVDLQTNQEPSAILRLKGMRVAIDRRRVGTVAWPDPEGPGSASILVERLPGVTVNEPDGRIGVGANTQDIALAAGTSGSLTLGLRTLPDSEPNTELRALGVGLPDRVVLSAAQLRVNQRIGQAAVARIGAALGRLRAVRAEHIRAGALGAAQFAPEVVVSGTPSGTASASPIAPLDIRPPAGGGTVRLSATQLLIGQRIAQAALRRADAARNVLERGLGGVNVVDGQITAATLAPGLSITAAGPSPGPPLGALPPRDRSPRPPVRLALTAEQLLVNQRIAQEAVLRADWVVERLEGGLSADDFVAGGLRLEDLASVP